MHNGCLRSSSHTLCRAHHGEAFYIDILLDQVYTTTICRMKGDRPRLTAPRENAPRLKARLGMEGQGTTAGG